MQRVGDQTWIVVINRSVPQRIEFFQVVAVRPVPRVVWSDCVAVPPNFALNDVVLSTDRELFATHMFTPPQSADDTQTLRADFLAARPTGYVLRWNAQTQWSRVPDTDLSFANGIALSRDGKWLAAAGTFDQAVVLIERDTGASRRVAVGLQPDNLTPAGAAGFVVAGHTGVPVAGIDPCRKLTTQSCGFPFAVARIDARVPSVAIVYRDPGETTPGASVALLAGGTLYLGSAFGDRITAVRTRAR